MRAPRVTPSRSSPSSRSSPQKWRRVMRIPAGITLLVPGAILAFALKGGHIGSLDLHAVGVILMLAGIVGMLLPMLIRNRSRLSRPTIRSRHDITDDGTRTVVNHADGSQTLVEHDDGAQTFAEHFDAGPSPADPSLNGGPRNHGPRPALGRIGPKLDRDACLDRHPAAHAMSACRLIRGGLAKGQSPGHCPRTARDALERAQLAPRD